MTQPFTTLQGFFTMPYTVEEGGRLNNFAIEPKVYQAAPLESRQKMRRLALALGGGLLVVALMTIAVGVSSH
jgi:hypothetical protein